MTLCLVERCYTPHEFAEVIFIRCHARLYRKARKCCCTSEMTELLKEQTREFQAQN